VEASGRIFTIASAASSLRFRHSRLVGRTSLLVEHFRVQMNRQYGLGIESVTRQALAIMGNHRWRGNVRELEAVLEQAMIFRGPGVLRPEDLDLGRARLGSSGVADVNPTDMALPETLTWSQREALRIVAERREVRRRDFIARCGISREMARRELGGLVALGVLRRVGGGRGARYILTSQSSK